MPRPTKRVKSFGAIDLHFHGAFGVDLMRATPSELDHLSEELGKQGVAGFSATTLSASAEDLNEAVLRLGQWIRKGRAPGAKPLGIHLEGPFLNSDAAGAHPPGILRKLTLEELESLWESSQKTLHILTLAPETLPPQDLEALSTWARKKKIRLSIGHTRCTQKQAQEAFDQGFSGVTHAWNAMAYHHREPGVMGAALGREDVFVELIPDEIHVQSKWIDWTLALHPDSTFFVSDAAPSAATDGNQFYSFGDLECRFQDQASRLPSGALCGGGYLLPDSFAQWILRESVRNKKSIHALLREHLHRIHETPLRAIYFNPSQIRKFLKKHPVIWEIYSSRGKVPAKIVRVTKKR